MKQTPTKKTAPKLKKQKKTLPNPVPFANPPPPQPAAQQLTPIDIMRGVVHQFDKLQQEHAKLVEQYTIVAYAVALHSFGKNTISLNEQGFRDALAKYRVTIEPTFKDGLVTIETSLQPL